MQAPNGLCGTLIFKDKLLVLGRVGAVCTGDFELRQTIFWGRRLREAERGRPTVGLGGQRSELCQDDDKEKGVG